MGGQKTFRVTISKKGVKFRRQQKEGKKDLQGHLITRLHDNEDSWTWLRKSTLFKLSP